MAEEVSCHDENPDGVAIMNDIASLHVVSDMIFRFSTSDNIEVNRRVREFGEAMGRNGQSSQYYARHRRTTDWQASADIMLGKKAEVAAMCVLRDRLGFPPVPVDFDVRVGAGKSWQPDLSYRDQVDRSLPNVHVKACSARTLAICRGHTWTFQLSNHGMPGGRDEVFDEGDGDLIALVYMEDWHDSVAIVKAVVPWSHARIKFRDPVLAKHKGAKICLYLQDFASVELDTGE